MLFNIGGAEILVIAMVALIAVGPEQLPVVLRKIGRAYSQVRSMTSSLRDEFMAGLDDATQAANPTSWMKGSGKLDDPIVPRGLADQKEAAADSPPGAGRAAPEPTVDDGPADGSSAGGDRS